MKLYIKTLEGKTLQVETSNNSSILEFKKDIFNQYNIPIDKQKIVIAGKIPADNDYLSSFSPQNLTIIHIVLDKN